MQFHFENTNIGELPQTFLAAQLNYLRHYRQLMRTTDRDDDGCPVPQLWHWAIMIQPEDLSLVPIIQAGDDASMPRWLSGHTLAIVSEETGVVLAWGR